jgi:hypothetical protein
MPRGNHSRRVLERFFYLAASQTGVAAFIDRAFDFGAKLRERERRIGLIVSFLEHGG